MKFSLTKPKQICGNCTAWPKSHVIADSDTKYNQSFSKWTDKPTCNIEDKNGFQRVFTNMMSGIYLNISYESNLRYDTREIQVSFKFKNNSL